MLKMGHPGRNQLYKLKQDCNGWTVKWFPKNSGQDLPGLLRKKDKNKIKK